MVIPSARIRLSPDVLQREEDDGFLLYDIRRDILYKGNDSGKQILDLCKDDRIVEEMIDFLSDAAGLPREEMSGYVGDFLAGLLDDNLVESVYEAP